MGKLHQFHAMLACSFGSLIMGLLNVWPSYTLSLYKSHNTTLLYAPMSDLECSLLGSLPSLGAMVGTAIVGVLIDKIGRKKGGVVISLPYVLSWAIIGQTSSTVVILIARFLSGVAGGAYLVYAPIFISEIADNSIRGALASGPIAFYCIGVLISYLLGWFSSYDNIIRLNLAASVLCVILPMTVVESPVYLLRQKREEEATAAISHYRGGSLTSKIVLEELSRLKQQIMPAVELVSVVDDSEKKEPNIEEAEKEKLNIDDEIPQDIEKMSPMKLLFRSPSSCRAFTVVFTVMTLQVFMGLVPVQVYARILFAHAAPNLSSHFCSVLFAVVLVSACLVTTILADRTGRRILLISSATMVTICMAILGFLLQTGLAPPWVSAVVILVYCFSFNFGSGTVPYVLLAEVFVPEVQGLASMLLVEWVWFINFVIIAVFPFLTKFLGIHGVFYVFAAVGAADAIVSFFIVPETKGLSNERIQEAFLKSRRK